MPENPSDYRPKYVKGARLPHLWIRPLTSNILDHVLPVNLQHVEELSPAERQLRQYSTLDLCRYDSFTLIINSSPFQEKRAADLITLLKRNQRGNAVVPIRNVILGTDFEVVFEEKGKDWLDNFKLGSDQAGGVLVRPDQHILSLICEDTSAEQLASELETAAGW